MSSSDVTFAVEQHLEYFPNGFFARLGSSFLSCYYEMYLSSPHARAFVAELDGQREGFLVGVLDHAAHRQHVLRNHGRQLMLCAARALIVRPRLLTHFLRTRSARYVRALTRHVRRSSRKAASARAQAVAVLDYIAVSRSAQGQGVGTRLTEAFISSVASAGVGRIVLVTLAGRDGAGSYYESTGWTSRGVHRNKDGRLLETYELDIAGATSDSHVEAAVPGTAPQRAP